MPEGPHEWLHLDVVTGHLRRLGCRILTVGRQTLLPADVPVFATFCNRHLVKLPPLNRLALTQYALAERGEAVSGLREQ